jgi:hypothetical protein
MRTAAAHLVQQFEQLADEIKGVDRFWRALVRGI